jgi:polyferredoxin/formate hydrogenlyase subunit 6/NADH:ubiquinone oxidoreductase subunit I
LKPKHLIRIRRTSQVFFLCLFLFLLAESRLPRDIIFYDSPSMGEPHEIRIKPPITFFFQLDPLLGLTSLVSGHLWIKGFAWAMAVLLMTLLLGRVFCGFICPFGTIHHLIGRFKPSLKGTALFHANRKTASQKVKYALLAAVIVSCLLGLNIAGWMDPISFLFRSLALAVIPGLGNGLAGFFGRLAGSDFYFLKLMSHAETLLWPVFGYDFKSFQTGWIIGLLFLGILLLNRIRFRFWCRTLCPLGALLGFFSGFSLLRLEKDAAKCTQCRKCVMACQGAAEPIPGADWQPAECLACFNCFDACPENALKFTFRRPGNERRVPDMGRRALLGGLAAGVSLPLFGSLDGYIHTISRADLIRPPGSVTENEFLKRCQRCGLCMKVCPTNAINPTFVEAGMAGFWTPTLLMTHGYCEYTCTLCGSVCPTRAIQALTTRQKIETPIRIGSAYFDRGRCLPWSGNGPCIVCEEHCPTSPKAIHLFEGLVEGPDGKRLEVKLPQVDLTRCIGCGICENKCPVRGRPAVRVISAGESRSARNRIML